MILIFEITESLTDAVDKRKSVIKKSMVDSVSIPNKLTRSRK